MSESRRCKILYLQLRDLITVLGEWKFEGIIRLPVLKGIPEGYTIRAVYNDWQRDAIGVVIEHPSFEEQSPGCIYPAMAGSRFGEEVEMVNLRQMTAAELAIGDGKMIVVDDPRPLELSREIVSATVQKKSWEFLGSP